MQAHIRAEGSGLMSAKDMVMFQSVFENGELLTPEK
jgi:hypothetical protein